ncbi:MAG: peptide ABC transporter substrate-binding protein, partial [Rhodospirillaceae bacterium]|nr:peptide ABC transporter substrate-binding protein [Rhodospirillaceae bacterium]
MKFHTVLAAAVIATALASTPALTQDSKRDELVIGVSQFPQGFHPNLASHVVLSLINGMTRRPFTVYDADWKLICMLCETLPSRAAGTIRDWTTPEGEP